MKITYALINLARSVKSEKFGATAIEYGLIAALVALGAVGAMGNFGNRSSAMWNYVQDNITQN